MAIVMDMSSYEIEREVAAGEEYGEAMSRAENGLQLALTSEQVVPLGERRRMIPYVLTNSDVETFLQQMSGYKS